MARQRNAQRSVALVTLGCARNEVDSEELAARLGSGGWELAEPDDAAVVLVNTCGFIDAAKKDSIDTVLAAADTGRPVVAVGCLAERYGADLAQALPEADAVLGFDAYPRIADRLDDVLAGTPIVAHQPRDRRAMAAGPARRGAVAGSQAGGSETSERAASAPGAGGGAPGTGGSEAVGQSARGNQRGLPGHGWVRGSRVRLSDSPVAYLKLASGCDRRCAFCAIPSFRGGFVSRPPEDLVVEARWLASTGARELVLVSENSTSYGKDLGDLGALEALLPRLVAIDGVARVRVSYLQPAETRPPLIEAIATMAGVAPYFDLSFQHASAPVLRRMRRFGSAEDFLELLGRIRSLAPGAGVRSNFIVGFPGESERDVDELVDFIADARLDAVGVFGYSDEEGTEAAGLDGKLDADTIADRVSQVSALADEIANQRAEERVGETVRVLVEGSADGAPVGRAEHQGPDDGTTRLIGDGTGGLVGGGPTSPAAVGEIVPAMVVGCYGVDLLAEVVGR